ncbi:MAG: DUF3794 domain-containing protein [Clostridia bacterium]|nr:DUF3794 domain-containing protein [Clostridia bacterium]
MSVELEKKIIKTHRTLNATGTQATMDNDIIVPDTQPDVKTVLQAEILPMICEKHIQRDYIILSGNVDYSIVYLSDEKDAPPRVKSISTRVPFTHQIEASGAQEAAFAGIKADVVSVDFSAVNSRKINIKSVVDFESNIIRPDDFQAVSNAISESELPCKLQEIVSFSLKDYAENEFELSDVMSIPTGSEMIEDILKVDVRVASKEIKSINGKLVAKGSLETRALYTDTAGQLQSMEGAIPFTEVLSIDDVYENDICESEYTLTDLQYSAAADSDGDASMIEVRARINAATCVYEQSADSVTEDLYSPDFNVSLARDKAKVAQMVCASSDKSIIKENISIPADAPSIARIYNVVVKPYVESAEISANKANISGVADTYIEYTSANTDAPVWSHKCEIPFEYSVSADCGKNAQISVLCDADDISYSAASATSADVRFSLNFDTKIIEEKEVTYIKDVEADEENAVNKGAMPAIVIYFAAKGEKMWDISKRYHTTTEAICAANGCDFPEVLTEPKKIMIPRKSVC